MGLYELLGWCFSHFYNLDLSNAAIHHAPPRWSPITFRFAEEIEAQGFPQDFDIPPAVTEVMMAKGKYPEDTGR
jgi:hypothetical protein